MSSTTAVRAAGPTRTAIWVRRKVQPLLKPLPILGIATLTLLVVLVVVPVITLFLRTLEEEGVWADVVAGRVSENLLWIPLRNSLAVGIGTTVGAVLIGAFLAWAVVMTDMRFKKLVGVLAMIPFALPSFSMALAWESVFRNDLVGGRSGILENLGLAVPDWLAWGYVPVTATLIGHYFSLSFAVIAAALATVNGELLEAGEMAGASRALVARSIALPIVTPALISASLLTFAEGISNFATPALLGLPVRFQTLSTRIYGTINTNDTARGYVLAIILIAISAVVLLTMTRLVGSRRSFATITGKGARRALVNLGRNRVWVTGLAGLLVFSSTILPGTILVLTSLMRRTNDFTSGFTTHYWTGSSDPAIAQGQRGVLAEPTVVSAGITTLALGLAVALIASVLGIIIGYVVSRLAPVKWLAGAINVFSFLPFLIPGIAFAAAYISMFGRPIGPFPALYGTFALLVLAASAYTLPFAAQTGKSSIGQVSREVEESAITAGAGLGRRLGIIIVPLSLRGVAAGAILVFVNIVRDLTLIVLLATPSTTVLAVITYRYASEGFTQFANAITVIIAAISVIATVIGRKLEGAAQPWAES